jgi:D-sedoheptulose 7-phosphate isomerase
MVSDIKILALDIDGVLTDGTATLSESGAEEKRVCLQDLDAITLAKRSGLTVVLVTGENTPAVNTIARRFGVEQVVAGAKDKLSAIEKLSSQLGAPLGAFCYVGDGDRDAPALSRVGLGLAPSNATAAAKGAAHRGLSRSGGAGAVAEAVELVLQLREEKQLTDGLESEMAKIVNDSIAAHQRFLSESLPTLARVARVFIRAIRSGHKILLFGNGGSAADAQHVAGELVGRFSKESEPWPAIALTTDSSILTAVGNDWEFADVFCRQVRALAKPGDVVVGISTSGRSPNVLRGLEAARVRGATTIGFTGAKGTAMVQYTDECFLAPADSTPRIQELHILAWHSVCEMVERELMAEPGAIS